MNKALTNRLARLLARCLSVYANDEWIGSMYFVVRRSIVDEATPAWVQLFERRDTIDLPAAIIERLATELGDRPLAKCDYERSGSSKWRVYRSPDSGSRALVATAIDSLVTALRIRTLYTASVAPLVDTPLADAPRIEDARIILAPCAPWFRRHE